MSSRAFSPEEVTRFEAVPSSAEIEKSGYELAKALCETTKDPAKALGILVRAVDSLATNILHSETPMPEVNIETLDKLLKQLHERVMSHAECARRLNERHCGDDEEMDTESPKVVVH